MSIFHPSRFNVGSTTEFSSLWTMWNFNYGDPLCPWTIWMCMTIDALYCQVLHKDDSNLIDPSALKPVDLGIDLMSEYCFVSPFLVIHLPPSALSLWNIVIRPTSRAVKPHSLLAECFNRLFQSLVFSLFHYETPQPNWRCQFQGHYLDVSISYTVGGTSICLSTMR